MEELTFLDLVVLQRIEPGTVIEKFGPKINSSFFEAANILGTMKQKGYIDFKSTYPGPSEVEVTGVGARVLEVADEKAQEAVDELDVAILQSIVKGVVDPEGIKSELNVRSGDIAFHIHKLVKQDMVSYSIKSGKITLSVTEDGFKRVGVPKVEKPAEEIIVTGEAPKEAPPAEPVKLDRWTRLKAKWEYYVEKFKKNPKMLVVYAVVLLVLFLIVVYLLLFFRMGS
ncbi:MAG: hypothetical protein QXF56_03865 [Candidatus Micrarchaeia archaeon]